MEEIFDIAIIGGGINGCAIAADAAARGLSVILLEKDDIASKTSSNSSKLIHGGLRYLELLDFSLVKKALDERQRLLHLAPHIVQPLSLVMPLDSKIRPAWEIRLGLFLYDHLSKKNKLPKSKIIKRQTSEHYFLPLVNQINKAFIFSDCRTDDARLTLENALQAKNFGAKIMRDTEVIQAQVRENTWCVTTKEKHHASLFNFKAKVLINASGAWIEAINKRFNIPLLYNISFVKGSHLLVKKLYEGDHAYFLQHEDKRVIFLIPFYEHTLIGTTDILLKDPLDSIAISPEEVTYLHTVVTKYFKNLTPFPQTIYTWSGVRSLLTKNGGKPQNLARDYTFALTHQPAPALTIYGGKITTYRQLAAESINQLRAVFPYLPNSCTENLLLPGAQIQDLTYTQYLAQAPKRYDWLEPAILTRYLSSYGTRTDILLAGCDKPSDLGMHFGHGLYQSEVDFLVKEEWARQSEDILWRRTKLGLQFNETNLAGLQTYLHNHYHG